MNPADPILPSALDARGNGSEMEVVRIDAAGVRDAAGVDASPGSLLVLVEGRDVALVRGRDVPFGRLRVLASGRPGEVDSHPAAAGARRIDRPDACVIPGLVNAHAHLDLTHMGPRPFDHAAGFVSFIGAVLRERHSEPRAIAESVALGVGMSLAGGVVAVGDIGGIAGGVPSLAPWRTLSLSPLRGVSFLEFLAIGRHEERGWDQAAAALDEAALDGPAGPVAGAIALGLSPHATNTVGLAAYGRAAARAAAEGMPICTHLAETPEEREFIARGTGPQRALLERFGAWDDALFTTIGRGLTPVAHLEPVLEVLPMLLAHVNDASDADIDILARHGAAVVYCPRASSYFGAAEHFGPHRYRDMVAAGIPVVLGTDSVVNLPPGDAGDHAGAEARISTFDDMRLLAQRDGADPGLLLRMATTAAAAAIGIDPGLFTFSAGGWLAGLCAVALQPAASGPSPLARALASTTRPEILLIGK